MATNRAIRGTLWFWLFLGLAVYIVVSAGLAVATADRCDGHLDGGKTWILVPPHWECPSREF
jgi:hypothetical protein